MSCEQSGDVPSITEQGTMANLTGPVSNASLQRTVSDYSESTTLTVCVFDPVLHHTVMKADTRCVLWDMRKHICLCVCVCVYVYFWQLIGSRVEQERNHVFSWPPPVSAPVANNGRLSISQNGSNSSGAIKEPCMTTPQGKMHKGVGR